MLETNTAALPSFPRISLEEMMGMTTLSERQFLKDYSKNDFTAEGEIVDLGCWFGSLTTALLLGLQENPEASSRCKIHAYDRFYWSDWMADAIRPGSFTPNPELQNTILGEFVKQVFPHDKDNQVLIYAGDVCSMGWNSSPIEMLVVDVMKSWKIASAIVKSFYSCLIPDKSLVFHQDYTFWGSGWIHLIHYRLRDYFEVHTDIGDSYTLVFKNTKEIPSSLLNKEYSLSEFSDEEVAKGFEYAESLLVHSSPKRVSQIRLAKAGVYLWDNQLDRAEAVLDKVNADGHVDKSVYDLIKNIIQTRRPS